MNIPGIATAGDTITWSDDVVTDYQGNFYSPAGYQLNYSLRGPAALDVQAQNTEGEWKTTITPAQSATLTPGRYDWVAYVTNTAGDRFTVGTGQINIKPDLTQQVAGYDGRSDAEKIVNQIDSAFVGWVASPAAEYSIAGRTYRREDSGKLMDLRGHYQAILAKEVRAQRMAQGLGDPTARFVQFRPSLSFIPGNGNW